MWLKVDVGADPPTLVNSNFMVHVATVGHSTSESTNGARSHHFLLNNRECTIVLYMARQLLVFCKLN